MKRLARLEKIADTLTADVADLKRAAWKTTEILANHSERFDRMDQRLGSMDQRLGVMDGRLGAVVDRLDRLIAVTIQGRTASTERLGDIERRLTRLEERIG